LNTAFVPVADNCSYTQTQPDAKGEFFRLVAEQGHYAGRTKPTATRQGLYACTAEGELLASINTRDGEKVQEMLRLALEKQRQRSSSANPSDVTESYEPAPGYRWEYPEGGLILKVSVRDLPRGGDETLDPRHNLDHVWFTKEEASGLLMENLQVGKQYPAPAYFARRIARFHLVDTVRGESPRWRSEDVKKAEMFFTVEKIDGDIVSLRLDGEVQCEAPPSLDVNPFSNQKVDRPRGVALQLFGDLRYNRRQEAFEKFDMIAVGQRWGATTYNARFDDLGPAPIGFAFEIAPNSPIDRVPPQAIRAGYFGTA
jgi:hypothetical protein